MQLSDLFFWSDANNNTGLENIRGDELAALISAASGGPSAQVGKGCAVQRAPSEPVADGFPGIDVTFTGFPNPFYDDLGFFDSGSPTLLTIPDVDPPIERVLITGNAVWSGSNSTNFQAQINHNGGASFQGGIQSVHAQGGTAITQYQSVSSGPTEVEAGDTFTLRVFQFSFPSASQTLARGTLTLLVVK